MYNSIIIRSITSFCGVIICLYVLLAPFFVVQGLPVFSGDARENAATTYYLWKNNIYSYDGIHPNYEREPLPSLITSIYVKYLSSIPDSTTLNEFITEPNVTKSLYKINAYLSLFLLVASGWLVYLVLPSRLAVIITLLSVWFFFVFNRIYLNNLLTELHASLFITLVSLTSLIYIRNQRAYLACMLGILLGCFALTKAVGLYLGFVYIFFVTFFLNRDSYKHVVKLQLLTLIAFILVISPWMYRNKQIFDEFTIAQRGGIVLLTRAVKNEMNINEFKGAFYVYSPPLNSFFETYLGFKRSDQAENGYLTRLIRRRGNDIKAEMIGEPSKAVSYFSRAFAIQQKVRINLFKEYHKDRFIDKETLIKIYLNEFPEVIPKSDKQLKKIAVEKILNNPWAHAKATILFAWRGIFSFNTNTPLINLFAFISMLIIPFVTFNKPNKEIIAVALFSNLIFWFYAFFTHFLPRYSAPLIPVSIICGLYIAFTIFRKLNCKNGSIQ